MRTGDLSLALAPVLVATAVFVGPRVPSGLREAVAIVLDKVLKASPTKKKQCQRQNIVMAQVMVLVPFNQDLESR